MRLAVPDLISNSYFPAIAAVELGLMQEEGLDTSLELMFPVTDAVDALREGEIDFLAGAAHAPLYDPRAWSDTTLVAALSQHMYWFLVVAADSPYDSSSWPSMRQMRIGAAPGPDMGLRQLLIGSGINLEEAGIEIAPVPGTDAPSVSFGVTAAAALAAGRIDAFWANGMGAEVAVRDGVGKVVFDARRSEGEAAGFTFPALMTTSGLIERSPDVVAAAVRAVVRAQHALRADSGLAHKVADGLFPPMEAQLIGRLIERDLPFYDAAISDAAVAGLQEFALRSSLPGAAGSFDAAVARQFAPEWTT